MSGWRPATRAVLALVLVAPLLSACGSSGFRPLYGASGIGANTEAKLAQVSIATIPGVVGQQIRNELIFQSTGGGGEAKQPTLKLEVAIRESVTSTLVRTDGDSSSQIYNIEARFQLVRLADNTVVMSGTSYGRASFERYKSIFSNVRASDDAKTRAAKVVAEDIKARLSAHLAGSA